MHQIATRHIGIRCDCGYRDESATGETLDSYLNRPCPGCGSPLLTKRDVSAIRQILTAADRIGALHGEVEITGDAKRYPVRFEMNEAGTIIARTIEGAS